MRSWWGIVGVIVLALGGCRLIPSGGGYGSTSSRGIDFTGQPGLSLSAASLGSDPALVSEAEQVMSGLVFLPGIYRNFTTGREHYKLQSGDTVYTYRPRMDYPYGWDYPNLDTSGALQLNGGQAAFTVSVQSPTTELTGLSLQGRFDVDGLYASFKPLWKLPFDSQVTSLPGLPDLTVNWELSGAFNGTPFVLNFNQQFTVGKHDFSMPI